MSTAINTNVNGNTSVNGNGNGNSSTSSTSSTSSNGNPQGAVPVSDPNLSSCLGFIEQASGAQAAGPFGEVALTAAERKGALKLPPKGSKMVTGLAGLWQEYGAALPTVELGQMSVQLATSRDIRTVWRASKRVTRALDDSALEAEKQVWSTATQIYTLLQTIARKDKTLQVALEPYALYFQEGAKTAAKNRKEAASPKPAAAPPPVPVVKPNPSP